MKTIRQIADEIGVSKQAVRNQIANLGLQSTLRKNGNQFAIDEKQETLILQAFGKQMQSESQSSQSENANQTQSESQTTLHFTLRILEKEIEFLRDQLKVKDEQLERLDKRLAEAQILHADTKKMPLLPKPMDLEESSPQGGLWTRIFKRKKEGV